MNLKDKIEKLAFNFENEDGTFKNSTIFLTDLFEIPEIKQLLIQRGQSEELCDCTIKTLSNGNIQLKMCKKCVDEEGIA